jgi:hypothetical protein
VVVDGNAEPVVAYEDAMSRCFRSDAAVQRPCAWLWDVGPGPGDSAWRLGDRDPRMRRTWVVPERAEFDDYSVEDWLDGVEPPAPRPLRLPE